MNIERSSELKFRVGAYVLQFENARVEQAGKHIFSFGKSFEFFTIFVLGLESDKDAGWLPVASDDDLLILGKSQETG